MVPGLACSPWHASVGGENGKLARRSMPKIVLSEEQLAEVIDLVAGELGVLSVELPTQREDDPDYVEGKHRQSVLLEIMEILEDA